MLSRSKRLLLGTFLLSGGVHGRFGPIRPLPANTPPSPPVNTPAPTSPRAPAPRKPSSGAKVPDLTVAITPAPPSKDPTEPPTFPPTTVEPTTSAPTVLLTTVAPKERAPGSSSNSSRNSNAAVDADDAQASFFGGSSGTQALKETLPTTTEAPALEEALPSTTEAPPPEGTSPSKNKEPAPTEALPTSTDSQLENKKDDNDQNDDVDSASIAFQAVKSDANPVLLSGASSAANESQEKLPPTKKAHASASIPLASATVDDQVFSCAHFTEVTFAVNETVTAGVIPAGSQEVFINYFGSLNSDLEIWDGDVAVVSYWGNHVISPKGGNFTYKGTSFYYSGYESDGGAEYIQIWDTTSVDLTIKAYGFLTQGSGNVTWSSTNCDAME